MKCAGRFSFESGDFIEKMGGNLGLVRRLSNGHGWDIVMVNTVDQRAIFGSADEAASRAEAFNGSVSVASLEELQCIPEWEHCFAHLRKDSRYYEIVERTIIQNFRYKYFVIRDENRRILGIQPFFLLDQDILAGSEPGGNKLVDAIRGAFPRFLKMRTLMVGCSAGEGHLSFQDPRRQRQATIILAREIRKLARQQRAALIVLKEFPSQYRDVLTVFTRSGFARAPSMPMTQLDISRYTSFEDYLEKALKAKQRKHIRKMLRHSAEYGSIELDITSDISPIIDEVYPLYLQVYDKATLKFEKLSKEFLCQIGQKIDDKAVFFLWRRQGKLIAFAYNLKENRTLFGEYLGLDYAIAYDIHLYFYIMRDVIDWAIKNGATSFVSTALSYAPKLQMRHTLMPLDLYVRHTSPLINQVLKPALSRLTPVKRDPILKRFPNFEDLW